MGHLEPSSASPPLLGFVISAPAASAPRVPRTRPALLNVDISADIPPVIRTEERLRQLQDMLERPPRDTPKLDKLFQQPSPFIDE